MSGKVDARAALTFVIIGGSIAGLATAFALQHAGHRCHILEASGAPRGVCIGLASPAVVSRAQLADEPLVSGSWSLSFATKHDEDP
jgi:monoamine oxidase